MWKKSIQHLSASQHPSLNSNIRFCKKQVVEYVGWCCWTFLGLTHQHASKEGLAHIQRPLNTPTDETERSCFFFSCSWSSDSKCMVFHAKEKMPSHPTHLTNFLSYLILYYTLDFPGIDVYLIPFFYRAWIFILPLLPCKNLVVWFLASPHPSP